MQASGQTQAAARRVPSHPTYVNEEISAKKTAFIIITVVGCIAILWPRVFYPMMFGGSAPKQTTKEQRGPGGCCGVVLDREKFLNVSSAEIGPQMYRKQLNIYTGEISLRQERPAHLHPESIYQAMRERGRAIPNAPTVPILERKGSPSNPPPRIVEGRPGPIPGMRPPMGAGSMYQPQPKGNSMGFLLPVYTILIVLFFAYTIMKIITKGRVRNAPYGPAPINPNFRKEVFGHENGGRVEELNGSKLGTNLHAHEPSSGRQLYNASLSATDAASNLSSTLKKHQLQHHQHVLQQGSLGATSAGMVGLNKETDQLMEIEKLRKRLEDTEKAMAKLIAEMNSDQFEAKQTNENSTSKHADTASEHTAPEHDESNDVKSKAETPTDDSNENQRKSKEQQRKRRDGSVDRSVAVLGMEVTASCEGGHKWTGRPPKPVFFSHNEHSHDGQEDIPEPQSIYLEGTLAHESQILVADSETTTEKVYDEELNGSLDEPAVVLSSKMTLSLINLDSCEENINSADKKNEIESPLADDIEIIGHDEK